MANNTITKEQLIEDLKNIGIKTGELLHLKVSLKSIGYIEGGANTLLDALLDVVGEEGTLVIDSFVESYRLPLSASDALKITDSKTPSYAGALANYMIKHPRAVRSKHPIQKFTAIGPLANKLMLNHTASLSGYWPLEEMINMGAKNLTIGSNTVGVGTTHVAIEKLGFTKKPAQYGVNYKDDNGDIRFFQVNWNGGCGRGFPKFIPLYSQKEGAIVIKKIGNAEAFYTDMKKTLDIEIDKLRQDPSFFFCDDPTCKDCRLAWDHSTGNYLVVKFFCGVEIIKQKIKKIYK